MFSLNLVEGYRPRGLKRMEVCNGIVIMALENCHIIRLSLESPEDIEGTRNFCHQMENTFSLLILLCNKISI